MKAADRYREWVAERSRQAYIKERTAFDIRHNKQLQNRKPPYKYRPPIKWDGGEDDVAAYKPIWPRLADFFIKNGLTPEVAIRKRFEISKGMNPPFPNQIAMDKYLNLYKEIESAVSENDVELLLKLDREYAKTAINSSRYKHNDKATMYTMLLLDRSLEISPLMRYCLAEELELPKVKKIVFLSALFQYLKAKEFYNKIWKNIIPKNFKILASQFSQQLKHVDEKEL